MTYFAFDILIFSLLQAAREKRERSHAAAKVKKAWGGFFNRKMARKHRAVMIPLLQKKGWMLSFKLRCARRKKLFGALTGFCLAAYRCYPKPGPARRTFTPAEHTC